jgi:hypothetical protein
LSFLPSLTKRSRRSSRPSHRSAALAADRHTARGAGVEDVAVVADAQVPVATLAAAAVAALVRPVRAVAAMAEVTAAVVAGSLLHRAAARAGGKCHSVESYLLTASSRPPLSSRSRLLHRPVLHSLPNRYPAQSILPEHPNSAATTFTTTFNDLTLDYNTFGLFGLSLSISTRDSSNRASTSVYPPPLPLSTTPTLTSSL